MLSCRYISRKYGKQYGIAALLVFGLFACVKNSGQKSEPDNETGKMNYSISNGQLRLKIDPEIGGRVASLQVKGQEVLKTSRDDEHLQWGSTVWPAPQKAWNWPPPPVLDQQAYEIIDRDKDYIIVRSKEDPQTNLQITKEFRFGGENQIVVKYFFRNTGNDTLNVGIWENTRVPFGGQCFVPAVQEEIDEPLVKHASGYAGISFNQQLQKPNKLQISGYKGRMVYLNDRVVFIKKFDHLPSGRIAPDQSLIEIYYDQPDQFVELEVHGAYSKLNPGQIQSMELIWELHLLSDPSEIKQFLN